MGSALRRLLLDGDQPPVGERAEALLMAADRAQHVAEVVEPALDAGTWVVTDRFSASTLAYQGYGRGLDRDRAGPAGPLGHRWARPRLSPSSSTSRSTWLRAGRAGRTRDRFEVEGDAFQQRVADGYRSLAAEAVTPWVVVDGTGSEAEVASAVWSGVRDVVGTGPDGGRGSGWMTVDPRPIPAGRK